MTFQGPAMELRTEPSFSSFYPPVTTGYKHKHSDTLNLHPDSVVFLLCQSGAKEPSCESGPWSQQSFSETCGKKVNPFGQITVPVFDFLSLSIY